MVGTIEDMLNCETRDNTIDGKCSGCGDCCSNLLPLSKSEIDRIKKYVKRHNIKDQAYNIFSDNCINFICPFRDQNKKICVIYEVRPAICRDYQCDKQNRKEITFSAMKFNEEYIPTLVRETIYEV